MSQNMTDATARAAVTLKVPILASRHPSEPSGPWAGEKSGEELKPTNEGAIRIFSSKVLCAARCQPSGLISQML